MRFIAALAIGASLITLGTAQEVLGVPQCAQACVQKAESGTGPCGFDFACYCSPPYSDQGLDCVKQACDNSDYQAWLTWATGYCSIYGGLSISSTSGGGIQATITSSGSSNIPTSFVTVTSAAGGGSATGTISSGQGAAAASSASSSSSSGSQPISAGTIAGAVVGGVLGLALIIAAVCYFLRRRKAQPSVPSQESSSATGSHGAPTQLSTVQSPMVTLPPNSVESVPVSSGGKTTVASPEVQEVEEHPSGEGRIRGF